VNRYAIIWSEDDRAWVADVPDLKSCAAFGSTPEEAFAEVHIAMDAWLAAARDAGLEIPKPHSSLIMKQLNDPSGCRSSHLLGRHDRYPRRQPRLRHFDIPAPPYLSCNSLHYGPGSYVELWRVDG